MKTRNNNNIDDEQRRINTYITLLAVPIILVVGWLLTSIFSLQEFFHPNSWGISVSWLVGGVIAIPAVIVFIWFFLIKK